MDQKFKRIFCSDGGYWRGKSAIQKLSKASGSTKEEAEKWLMKQPLYQIYLLAPKYIPRPMQASHYLLHQTISIRVVSLVCPMTDTKRKRISMLLISWMLPVVTKDHIN